MKYLEKNILSHHISSSFHILLLCIIENSNNLSDVGILGEIITVKQQRDNDKNYLKISSNLILNPIKVEFISIPHAIQ